MLDNRSKDQRIAELELTVCELVDASVVTDAELKYTSHANYRKRRQLKRLQSQQKCWWCRLKRWFRCFWVDGKTDRPSRRNWADQSCGEYSPEEASRG